MKSLKPLSFKGGSPTVGLVESFSPGEFDRVEYVLSALKAVGVTQLRTAISWAAWHTSEGDGWYAWLLPRLAKEVSVLPTFLNTPPSLGLVPKFSSPPQTPKSFADFLDVVLTRFGSLFEWIELWDRPDDPNKWDQRLDPDWRIFSEMIGGAAYWARKRGKKTLLPGMWPANPEWLSLMHERGVLKYIDAVGIHGFAGSTEFAWSGWAVEANRMREHLGSLGSKAQLWISTTGSSTWRDDERGQLRAFVDAVDAPVERIYWREVQDRETSSAFPSTGDERELHYGLTRSNGSPKLLYSLWSKGSLDSVRKSVRDSAPSEGLSKSREHILITGGAGFIGTNLADRLLSSGRKVLVYDDLSRPGVKSNLAWLRSRHGNLLDAELADIRNRLTLRTAVRSAEQVFHFAAQVAVTTSLSDPLDDFDINVKGTLHILEELRSLKNPPPLLFTSTNKVYGALGDLELQMTGTRYQPMECALRAGINEERRLDFHSPYGCSKGAADQYVLDYARSFHLPTVVFRMSCIYGYHQQGTEDQGWVAHFILSALHGEPITIYGDGKQVRDLLFADDLVDALLLATGNIHSVSGQAFNIGGGLGNTVSLWELLEMIRTADGSRPAVRMEAWRCGDQRYYVSDTRKFKAATGWSPKVNAHEGVKKLQEWFKKNLAISRPVIAAVGR